MEPGSGAPASPDTTAPSHGRPWPCPGRAGSSWRPHGLVCPRRGTAARAGTSLACAQNAAPDGRTGRPDPRHTLGDALLRRGRRRPVRLSPGTCPGGRQAGHGIDRLARSRCGGPGPGERGRHVRHAGTIGGYVQNALVCVHSQNNGPRPPVPELRQHFRGKAARDGPRRPGPQPRGQRRCHAPGGRHGKVQCQTVPGSRYRQRPPASHAARAGSGAGRKPPRRLAGTHGRVPAWRAGIQSRDGLRPGCGNDTDAAGQGEAGLAVTGSCRGSTEQAEQRDRRGQPHRPRRQMRPGGPLPRRQPRRRRRDPGTAGMPRMTAPAASSPGAGAASFPVHGQPPAAARK